MISRKNIIYGKENKDKGTRTVYWNRCNAMEANYNSYFVREEYLRYPRYKSIVSKKKPIKTIKERFRDSQKEYKRRLFYTRAMVSSNEEIPF